MSPDSQEEVFFDKLMGSAEPTVGLRDFDSIRSIILSTPQEDIEADVLDEAAEVLAVLQQFQTVIPHLFFHGGDTIVLTWPSASHTIYVTIAGARRLPVLEQYHSGGRHENVFSLDDTNDIQRLVRILGGKPWTSTQTGLVRSRPATLRPMISRAASTTREDLTQTGFSHLNRASS
jgi:hypothetical protein